jgi:hypothetical protein
MLDRAGAGGDADAVADEADRLVAEGEADEDAVDGVLELAGDAVVVLGGDDQVGVGQSRRSSTSTSKSPCRSARSTTQGTTLSAERVGRVLPTMICSLGIGSLSVESIETSRTIVKTLSDQGVKR